MKVRVSRFWRQLSTAFGAVVIAAALLGLLIVGGARAAQTATVGGNALKVSPVRLDLTMDPGMARVITVSIKNLTNVVSPLHVMINDFTAGDQETGQPNIILEEDEFAPSHSLKRFATPPPDVSLAPGEERNVQVALNVPGDAAGGGYYGAVRFVPAGSSGDRNVNLAASVGTLVLLRVNGDVKESLSVASFDVRRGDNAARLFTSPKDLVAAARFSNSGNVQVEPFGTIILKRFGKTVATYQVNNTQPRGSVLPDSIRRFDTKLDKLSAFGKFTLEANFGYGTSGQLLTATATFYVVPLPVLIVVSLAVAVLILAVVFVPRMVKSYNRRVIRRANSGRR